MINEFDKKTIDDFVLMIKGIVKDVIKQMNTTTESFYNGIVVGVDNEKKTASVDIGDMILNDLPNKTGEELFIKEEGVTNASFVRIYTTTPTMTDAYIGRKLD